MDEKPEGIVWVKSGCPRCAAIKERLSDRRIEYRPIEVVLSGQDPHRVDALAQLAWQDCAPHGEGCTTGTVPDP